MVMEVGRAGLDIGVPAVTDKLSADPFAPGVGVLERLVKL
jgi:hypothetical protein